MKIGDVLAKLDTKWWPSAIEVSGIVKNTGKDLPVKVLRNGKIVSLGSIKLIGGKLGTENKEEALARARQRGFLGAD